MKSGLARATDERQIRHLMDEWRRLNAEGEAAAWSHLTVVLTPNQGSTTSEASRYVLTVFHRSPSGKWRLAHDAYLVAGAGNPHRV
jgi:ketosteroid isomerase-like protein